MNANDMPQNSLGLEEKPKLHGNPLPPEQTVKKAVGQKKGGRQKLKLAGLTFGWLSVTRFFDVGRHGHSRWLCLCRCGKPVIRTGAQLIHDANQSCGCFNVKHGHARGGSQSPEYRSWFSMIARCTNPKNIGYPRYGGRGITVCERWLSFQNFLSDMGNKPSAEHSIERKDNNGNYEPGNCVWATRHEQGRNKRNNRIVEFRGTRVFLMDLAKQFNVTEDTLRWRIVKLGWPVEKAVATPVRRYKTNPATLYLPTNQNALAPTL